MRKATWGIFYERSFGVGQECLYKDRAIQHPPSEPTRGVFHLGRKSQAALTFMYVCMYVKKVTLLVNTTATTASTPSTSRKVN